MTQDEALAWLREAIVSALRESGFDPPSPEAIPEDESPFESIEDFDSMLAVHTAACLEDALDIDIPNGFLFNDGEPPELGRLAQTIAETTARE